MHQELHKVGGPRDPPAMGIHPRNVHAIWIVVPLAVILDLLWAALSECIACDRHIVDAAALEYRIAHKGGIRLARDFLDHASEHAIAAVGVGILLNGRMIQWPASECTFNQLGIVHPQI